MGMSTVVYGTEFWRDPDGRGRLLHGALDAPQVVAMAGLIAGAWLLMEREKYNEK